MSAPAQPLDPSSQKPASTYTLTRWLFVRWIGMIYLLAFASLAGQITGLYGTDGILPLRGLVHDWHNAGLNFFSAPSLFWFGSSNTMLVGVCIAAIAASVSVLFGLWPAGNLFILWFLYLSVTSVGLVFMSFQWDFLLLETGLLSVFFAPWCLSDRHHRKSGVSRWGLWLLRLLLFKLMFLSGFVKLSSGDPTWRNLTALSYHYMTQPLPNPLSWFAYQCPLWFQRSSTAIMFFIELIVPFSIFGPRKIKMIGSGMMIALQFLILLTGNYNFFNLLAIGLCFVLIDDQALAPVLQRLMPGKRFERSHQRQLQSSPGRMCAWSHRVLLSGLSALIALMTLFQLAPPDPASSITGKMLTAVARRVMPFGSVNTYGLFAVMTTQRIEIEIQGSDDGANWKPYLFKYKPGPLNKMPLQVAPFQPRLDWQMWFAALTPDYRYAQWFLPFAHQLLAGSPDVLALLADNPFPDHPPQFLRALRYEYDFTTPAERARTGNWWKRTPAGTFCPMISLESFQSP